MTKLELPIYLDGHATTPLAPEAAAAMEPWWHSRAANPHSPHSRGLKAAVAVEGARAALATLIGADPQEIVFTSGATEANNLVILGIAESAVRSGDARREMIVSAIEHKSVLSAAHSLAARGFVIHVCPVTSEGLIDLEAFARLISEKTLLVSLMGANNEIGTVQPVSQVLPLVRAAGAMIHVDMAQVVGKLPVDVSEYDFASISAHKIYGPMGVGALFVSAAAQLRPAPMFYGGSQENGFRPGTLPTPLIVGFGAAAFTAQNMMRDDAEHGHLLTSQLEMSLRKRQVTFQRTVLHSSLLPGSLSIRIINVNASQLIGRLYDTVSLSEGSACSSGQITHSHVLQAIGLSESQMDQTIRIYCSRYNTAAEVDFCADAIAGAARA